jgi:hypothetical protein
MVRKSCRDNLFSKGAKIDLELGEGLGTAQFEAPSVIGMPLDEAKIAIIGAGLESGAANGAAFGRRPGAWLGGKAKPGCR